jgi:hypothetical protein
MLNEIIDTRQVAGEGPRRWFTDAYFDLIIWYDRDRTTIKGFQLCYDKEREERALTWRREAGFDHKRIDDGDITGRMKMTPILVPDGSFDYTSIAGQFLRESTKLDPEIRAFVYNTLMHYPKDQYGRP